MAVMGAAGEARYPIRAVARLTGLGIDTLRAWERRYSAVTPVRDERGRLYTEADVARLRLLHQAVAAGHSIGRLAPLTNASLRKLARPDRPAPARDASPAAGMPDLSRCEAAIAALDSAAIDRELSRLAALLPTKDLIRDVVLPLARRFGDDPSGAGEIAREHAVSAALRHLLGSLLRVYAKSTAAPPLLFTTLSGDRHEIGTLSAAVLAASHGFGAVYLGPDLPAQEILGAVNASSARVLVLGVTMPASRQNDHEVRAIASALPRRVELWAGGPGAAPRAAAFGRRALVLTDLDDYVRQLERLRETDSAR